MNANMNANMNAKGTAIKKLKVKHQGDTTKFSVSTKRGKGVLHPLISHSMSEAMSTVLKGKAHFS